MSDQVHRRPGRTLGRSPLPARVFTVDEARAAGWSPAAQRHAVRLGELERVQRGVLRWRTEQTNAPARAVLEAANLDRARGAALVCRRGAISHQSAAIAHGMPTVGGLERSCLTVPAGTALRELARVHLHRATLSDDDVRVIDGYRVLAEARTIMDLARERGVPAGVVAADYALHTGLVGPHDLREAFEACRRWPGQRAARITLLSADGRAESPLESLSRLRLAAARLPAPELQQEICDLGGNFLGRCDFYWDEYGVIGEADGDLKYIAHPVLAAQRERQGELERAGLLVVRWGGSDLSAFGHVVRRLETNFTRGARRGSPHRRWGLLLPP